MGFPGRTVDVPPAAPAPALAALVRAIEHDPFGEKQRLAEALEGRPTPGMEGHLCTTAWVLDRPETGMTVLRVLLIRHPVLGWSTPGGHLEQGEEPADGAVRELHEETGLRLTPSSPVPAVLHATPFPAGLSGPAHRHHNLGFRFDADPAAPLTEEPDAPARWFPVGALPEPRVPDLAIILPLLAARPD